MLGGGDEEHRVGAGERLPQRVGVVVRRLGDLDVGQVRRTGRVAHDQPLPHAGRGEAGGDATAERSGGAGHCDRGRVCSCVLASQTTTASTTGERCSAESAGQTRRPSNLIWVMPAQGVGSARRRIDVAGTREASPPVRHRAGEDMSNETITTRTSAAVTAAPSRRGAPSTSSSRRRSPRRSASSSGRGASCGTPRSRRSPASRRRKASCTASGCCPACSAR